MRILKKKIALAAQIKQKQISLEEQLQEEADIIPTRESLVIEKKITIESERENCRKSAKKNSTKTIVKNYGKAIASFAMGKIGKPYLNPLLKREGIKVKAFVNYMSAAKESIEGIETLRALLLVQETDSDGEAGYKKIFKEIAEVFIKYFSANWIFSGRMANKDAHLRCRFKMLRRIKNPEFFTYLK